MISKEDSDEFSPDWERHLKSLLDQPPELFNLYRIAILLDLYHVDSVDYSTLRDSLKLSDGLLSNHLSALKRRKLIQGRKELQEDRHRTMLSITNKGVQALEHMYRNLIQVKGRVQA